MTEEEWLASGDLEPMLELLISSAFPEAEPCNWGKGERKKRLFVAGCVHRIRHLVPVEYQLLAESLELGADGLLKNELLHAQLSAAEGIRWHHDGLLFAISYDDLGLLCYIAAGISADATTDSNDVIRMAEARKHASLLREIFGNPFRPLSFSPVWRTAEVMLLANGIYAEKAFDRMPILADALQDAGCDSDNLLDHLRDPHAAHVRGCWALDLVLGKE